MGRMESPQTVESSKQHRSMRMEKAKRTPRKRNQQESSSQSQDPSATSHPSHKRMIPLLAFCKQPIMRRATCRLATRSLARIENDPVRRASAFLSTTGAAATLPPVLPPPSPPPPQTPQAEKGIVGKVMNRYSVQDSQNRIRVAEAFFQAATRQGADA